MAIPTVFDITFGCGHAGQVDAADRAADQRGPWIAYLSSKGMCPDCFEATRDKRRELARTKWIAGRRTEEEAAIGAWETEVAAMTLTGSVKQVGFARRVRYEQLKALYEWAVQEDGDRHGYQRVEPLWASTPPAGGWTSTPSSPTPPTSSNCWTRPRRRTPAKSARTPPEDCPDTERKGT
jgi:hypothetical protein